MRLETNDPTLIKIYLFNKQDTDADLIKLVECLLAHPNVITELWLDCNRLTDETGVKLARYLTVSSTIRRLGLNDNQFGEATYLAVAAALCINTSLKDLYLYCNQAISIEEKICIDSAFVDALIVNPDRPTSEWWLYSWDENEFDRLKATAETLGHPSMQAMMAMLSDQFVRMT